MDKKKIGGALFWVVLLAVLFFAANNYYNRYKGKSEIDKKLREQMQNVDNGQGSSSENPKAPDFALKDLDGKSVKLSDYEGKIVVLNFWATWCPPCIREIPDLIKASEELSKGEDAVVLAVNLTNGYNGETEDRVKKFVKDNKMTMKVLMDKEDDAAMKYGIASIPTTFIINRDGTVYDIKNEPVSYKQIIDIVDKIK